MCESFLEPSCRSAALLLMAVWPASALSPPVPSAIQLSFMKAGWLTMFQHFELCTFNDCQMPSKLPPAASFAPPDDMSTDLWMETAKVLGASEVCLTVRHATGFSLWPTSSSNFSIAASPWRGGKGDILADFTASARKYGILPCFYILLGINMHEEGVPGDEYLSRQKVALKELLTSYGPIHRMWWDEYARPSSIPGFSCPDNVLGPECPAWTELGNYAKSLSPNTTIIPGPDGCLNNPETISGYYPIYHANTALSYACLSPNWYKPSNGTLFQVTESDYSIENPGDLWFWNPNPPVMSPQDIFHSMLLKGGAGTHVIFNVPPNSSGIIPEAMVSSISSYSAMYHSTFDTPIASLTGPVTGLCPGLSATVDVEPSAAFDILVTEEDLSGGQIIGGYTVEARTSNGWVPLKVKGITVGTMNWDAGIGMQAGISALRFNCTVSLYPESVATLNSFAAYRNSSAAW